MCHSEFNSVVRWIAKPLTEDARLTGGHVGAFNELDLAALSRGCSRTLISPQGRVPVAPRGRSSSWTGYKHIVIYI